MQIYYKYFSIIYKENEISKFKYSFLLKTYKKYVSFKKKAHFYMKWK